MANLLDARSTTRTDEDARRRRARELVLQGLYQWQLSRQRRRRRSARSSPKPAASRRPTRATSTGCGAASTGEFDALLAAFAPYLDRAAGELSPIETGDPGHRRLGTAARARRFPIAW